MDDELIAAIRKGREQVGNFADEMRAKGIHVGLGANPRCVTCGERWPCTAGVSGE